MSGETEDGNHRVSWRVYVDALVLDLRQTLEHEAHDRETTAQALRIEHQAAMQLAAEEREKAAQALRIELTRATNEGDDRLREHIIQAIEQVDAALESSEKLEIERVEGVAKKLASVQRQIEISQEAQKEAVLKAEMASERRFEGINEFRAQLSDQQATFISREAVDGLIKAVDVRITSNADRMTRIESAMAAQVGAAGQRAEGRQANQWAIGVVIGIVLAIAAIAGHLVK